MEFTFTEEQEMIRQAAKDYAERELIKDVLERDEKAEIPWQHIKNLKELGFFGMMVDPQYGGGGMDSISAILALEEFSKVDASIAVILSVHNSLVCTGIDDRGRDILVDDDGVEGRAPVGEVRDRQHVGPGQARRRRG